jgi:hypothetical protein
MIDIPPHVLKWLEDLERSAYQKGWDDATAAHIEAIRVRRPASQVISVAAPAQLRMADKVIAQVRKETHRQRIIRALSAHPGMRTVALARQLVEEISEAGGEGSLNAIRTTIKRMVKDGSLRKESLRLYVNEPERQDAAE